MTEHSVIIDETFNLEQDLLFLNDLSNNLTQFFNEIDILKLDIKILDEKKFENFLTNKL